MQRVRMTAYALAVLVFVWGVGTTVVRAQVRSQDGRIDLVDNCDPNTFPNGLCVVTAHPGDTTFAEFMALLFSPLSPTVVGHPAWRFEPSYVNARGNRGRLRVTNSGGEGHTFTEVPAFGGGFVSQLNGVGGPTGTSPLVPADQCLNNPAVLAPGATVAINLAPGLHNFQCCIHPWMRAVVDVEDED